MNRTNISTELSRTLKKYEEQLVLPGNISTKVINVKAPHGRLTIPANSEVTLCGTTRQDIENCAVLVEPPVFPTPILIVYQTLNKVKNCMVSKPTPIADICPCDIITPKLNIEEGNAVVDIKNPDTPPNNTSWESLPFEINIGNVRTNELVDRELRNLFHNYSDVFFRNHNEHGYADQVEHIIHTTSDVPFRQPDRRVPPQIVSEVQKLLTAWFTRGIIRENNSPYASQMVLVSVTLAWVTLSGIELPNFYATREHSTPSPMGISQAK